MKTVTVSSKGQITLPKDLRERFHLLEGEQATVAPTADGILIKHRQVSLRGLLRGRIDVDSFEGAVRRLRKEWSL